eukprot:scaffold347_cov380-Prasinococcus_capsulatus_cf.AAC.35
MKAQLQQHADLLEAKTQEIDDRLADLAEKSHAIDHVHAAVAEEFEENRKKIEESAKMHSLELELERTKMMADHHKKVLEDERESRKNPAQGMQDPTSMALLASTLVSHTIAAQQPQQQPQPQIIMPYGMVQPRANPYASHATLALDAATGLATGNPVHRPIPRPVKHYDSGNKKYGKHYQDDRVARDDAAELQQRLEWTQDSLRRERDARSYDAAARLRERGDVSSQSLQREQGGANSDTVAKLQERLERTRDNLQRERERSQRHRDRAEKLELSLMETEVDPVAGEQTGVPAIDAAMTKLRQIPVEPLSNQGVVTGSSRDSSRSRSARSSPSSRARSNRSGTTRT